MKTRKAAIGFIFFTILIDVIGFGIIIPVIPRLITSMTGGTISDASKYGGMLMFSFAIMQFVFSPILGALSDQYGRRKILLISLFGFGLDYLLAAWAPTIAWLFVGRLLAGVMGASFTTASAYIADVSTDENRSQNFGMLGAAFGLGFIIGPTLGGILGQIEALGDLRRALPMFYQRAWMDVFTPSFDPAPLRHGALWSLVYVVGFVGLGYAGFRRKDVLS